MKGRTTPSIYEYVAASMITIATVWLWAQASIHVPGFFGAAPPALITAASYGFYALGCAAASYMVLNKTGNREVMTGLKVGAFSFVASSLYYSASSGVNPNLIAAMFFSFTMGGPLGAIARIKQDARAGEARAVDTDDEPDDDSADSEG